MTTLVFVLLGGEQACDADDGVDVTTSDVVVETGNDDEEDAGTTNVSNVQLQKMRQVLLKKQLTKQELDGVENIVREAQFLLITGHTTHY